MTLTRAMVSSDYRLLKCDEALLYSEESVARVQDHFGYEPDRIHLVEALPSGTTGKADRNALRRQLMSTKGDDMPER